MPPLYADAKPAKGSGGGAVVAKARSSGPARIGTAGDIAASPSVVNFRGSVRGISGAGIRGCDIVCWGGVGGSLFGLFFY
jgi:hypothetical protein